MKRLIKHGLRRTVASFGPHRWPSRRDQLTVLMYHRILPQEDSRAHTEQPGMVVTPETFERHLGWITRYFEPVRLTDWIEGKVSTHRRPACAITFDDGWRDNYEYAFPLLRAAGIPATVFVVSDLMGTNRDFWPGRLQRLLRDSRTAPATVEDVDAEWLSGVTHRNDPLARSWDKEETDALIGRLKRIPDAEIEERLTRLERLVGIDGDEVPPVLLDWSQIDEMVADGTFDVGSHTRHHHRLLDVIPAERIRDEVVGSQQVISDRTGHRAELFCYPNGDFSDEAERLVREHYAGACIVRKGWNAPDTDPYQLRRVSVHEDVSRDRSAFLARADAVF